MPSMIMAEKKKLWYDYFDSLFLLKNVIIYPP